MLEVKQFVIDENEFVEGAIFEEFSAPLFPITYDELKNSYKVTNYISFDGLGIDLLDDNKQFYKDEYTGYISPGVSSEKYDSSLDGYPALFAQPIVYTVADNKYPEGITIRFYGHCCSKVDITYLYVDLNGNNDYHYEREIVNDTEKYIRFNTYLKENYTVKEIEIEFLSTPLPNQLVKIQGIIEGKINTLNKFRSSNLLEEINILSDDLPINSLDFEAVLEDVFEKEDPVNVYSNGRYYGTFFVDDAERVAANIYNVKCLNSVGLLEAKEFKDWNFDSTFNNKISGLDFFLEKMFDETSIKVSKPECNYFIYGHVPIESYRKALCEYAYACGFMVDSSRSDALALKNIPTEISGVINKERIIGDSSLTKNQVITSAKIQYPAETTNDSFVNDYKNFLGVPKEERIYYEFENPVILPEGMNPNEDYLGMYFIYALSGNYIDFKATRTGSPSVSFKKIDYQYINEIIHNEAPGKAKPNEKDFSQIKIYSGYKSRSGGSITSYLPQKKKDIKKYIQSRGKVKAKIILQNEKIGDLVQIETAYDGIITGIITSMNISFGYKDVADIEVLEWQIG